MNMRNREFHTTAEQSPLLINQTSSLGGEDATPISSALSSSDNDADDADGERGQATLQSTVTNLAKTCAGTGILALPYACSQAGPILFGPGLILIAVWNIWCVDRLVQCLKLVHTTTIPTACASDVAEEDDDNDDDGGNNNEPESPRQDPPSDASTLSKVAFVAWGPLGLQLVDAMMVVLLLGIIVSYLAGVISFLADTPLTCGPLIDAFLFGAIMALLSMVPDLGYLSGASAIGLFALLGTFVVITGYGLVDYRNNNSSSTNATIYNHLWPLSLHGLARFFGVCVFGYGVVPLTYNFRDSMKEPGRMVEATTIALSLVALGYCAAGVGLLALFPEVNGQILHELPKHGILPTFVRVSMAVVCVVTAPLIIVPAGEMLEAKFQISHVYIRSGVCLVSAIVAVLLPTFVQVLSFVGCFCVGTVGFCIPPLLHLRLVRIRGIPTSSTELWVDRFMFAFGLFATIVGTLFTI